MRSGAREREEEWRKGARGKEKAKSPKFSAAQPTTIDDEGGMERERERERRGRVRTERIKTEIPESSHSKRLRLAKLL